MFQNLRIKERLTKSFRVIALTSAIAAVLGVIMLLITLSQYKNALTNYGFSQGDIGKAMVCLLTPDLQPAVLSVTTSRI